MLPPAPAVAVLAAFGASVYVAYELRRSRERLAAAALQVRASEERNRLMADNASDLIWRCRPDGTIIYASPACRALLGFAPDDLLGSAGQELIAAEDRDAVGQAFTAFANGEGTFTCRVLRKDGSSVWLETRCSSVYDAETGCISEILAISRDVSARRRADEAVQRSEKHFRSLIEHASDLVAVMTPEGTLRYVSPSHERVLGYRPEDLLGRPAFELACPDDLIDLGARFAGVQAVGEATMEFRFRHCDGSWRHIEGRITDLCADPVIAGYVVNSRDITERRRAEEALRESESIVRSFYDSAQMMMGVVELLDDDVLYVSTNSATADFFGQPADGMAGRRARDIGASEADVRVGWRATRKVSRPAGRCASSTMSPTATPAVVVVHREPDSERRRRTAALPLRHRGHHRPQTCTGRLAAE